MVCRLSTLFTVLQYLVCFFVPINQYQIRRVRPRQESLHTDHAWRGKTHLFVKGASQIRVHCHPLRSTPRSARRFAAPNDSHCYSLRFFEIGRARLEEQ